jgi:hypothetical protein
MKPILIVLMLSLSALAGGQSSPREIVKKSHNMVKVSSFEAISVLTTTDASGNTRTRKSSMASKTYSDGTEKRIIKFLEPAEVKGTGILIFDHEEKADDMWIFLPALRKTRRIVSSEKSKSFMGSEFSNADMTAPLLDDFTYTLEGEAPAEGVNCFIIKSKAVSMDVEDEYGYSASRMWIGKEDFMVRKSYYYDYSDHHFKTIENVAFTLLDKTEGKYMVTEMKAENLDNHRRSVMFMEKVALADSKDAYFTLQYLER